MTSANKTKEALYYVKREDGSVRCELCPHFCLIRENELGNCGVRQNINGKLIALTYNKIVSIASDPIEKKPLYNFLPGTEILSFGSVGCNLSCVFCQNWQISQATALDFSFKDVTPEEAVDLAIKRGVPSIAFTYNEPLIQYEWVKDTAEKAVEKKIKGVLVTNGLINEKPLEELIPYISAANVDVKAFNDEFYERHAGLKKRDVVLSSIKKMVENEVHVELTMLLIPGENDDPVELEAFIDWAHGISDEIPLHFSKFHPDYKMLNKEATPVETVLMAVEKSKERGMKYVYAGNIARKGEHGNTYCSKCKNLLIEREIYYTKVRGLDEEGKCKSCNIKTSIQMK
ncbi:MAG: AmmeMemoRadiSam system radical SAM enzyme [Candidatus Kariarchaeaceae archaeon]